MIIRYEYDYEAINLDNTNFELKIFQTPDFTKPCSYQGQALPDENQIGKVFQSFIKVV